MLTPKEVEAYLHALKERELLELLGRVLTARDENTTIYEESCIDRLCLAATSYGGDPPTICLVAQVAPEVEHIDWDSMSQTGMCGTCNSDVLSFAKLAICPVCSNLVACS